MLIFKNHICLKFISRIFFIFFVIFISSGCDINSKNEKITSGEIITISKSEWIKLDDDVYLIPKGKTKDGCQYYTTYSKKKSVASVIYYRTSDNKFTINKNKALCKK
tara:strand:+ start:233 stop:553 length:321 start_codon:yes stop_codon:yes gene_type:complete